MVLVRNNEELRIRNFSRSRLGENDAYVRVCPKIVSLVLVV